MKNAAKAPNGVVTSGETSLIQNYKHAGSLMKNSARKLPSQAHNFSGETTAAAHHVSSQEQLFQITMPMIQTSKLDHNSHSIRNGTKQMDTSHAVNMHNFDSSSFAEVEVESIESLQVQANHTT